jgi:SAM-dependent methyltransferase
VTTAERVRQAYDGSSVVFRLARSNGWGPLLNLGYFTIPRLPLLVAGLAPFQRRLVEESTGLLAPRPGERILDACCGLGYTTARIADSGAHVLGLDLLEEHVALAQSGFGTRPNVSYACADVTRLPRSAAGFDLDDGAVDGIHCLEAAFHLGPAGRRAFLSEAFRLLRPGGRLVLVDFVWRDERPERIADLDPDRAVRDTWRFDEFEPLARYRRAARDVGFRESILLDWTVPVMDRFARVSRLTARLGITRLGRGLLRVPPVGTRLGNVPVADWQALLDWLEPADAVRHASQYVALLLEKPAPPVDRDHGG